MVDYYFKKSLWIAFVFPERISPVRMLGESAHQTTYVDGLIRPHVYELQNLLKLYCRLENLSNQFQSDGDGATISRNPSGDGD